jgi:S-DNA-T family DNA segregation ATPase FtsK/SpoIIIE
MVDVPAEQCRTGLHWNPAAGNLALLGAVGSGTTTALLAIVGGLTAEHVYVIDGRGDERLTAVAGAVVRPHETERVGRLLDRLAGEIDRRRAGGREDAPDVVFAVDGLLGLRAALDAPTDHVRWEQLVRIVGEGPAVGITSIVTSDRPSAMPASVLGACAERWVFHLADPHEASACGVRPADVPSAIPGRLVVASTGCAAQVAAPADRPGAVSTAGPVIDVLPRSVDASRLPSGAANSSGDLDLVLGIDHATLGVAPLTVPPGEHVLVVGPARSGRTTALARLAESWQQARPDGRVIASSTVGPDGLVPAVEAAGSGPVLVVVDDAEHVDAPGLAALLAARRPDLLVIAAGRPASLRAAYGHWTTVLRRSRLGLLMASCADTDGDLLGELLPRHRPLAARPGLAWVVDGGERRLVQLGWRPERGP